MPRVAKKKSDDELNSTTYELFLRSVRLYSLGLDSISASLDRDAYWDNMREADSILREISASYTAKDIEGDHFNVVAEYKLTVRRKGDQDSALFINCQYSAHFHADGECDEIMADRFANSEAKIIMWPYFRNLVSETSGRLHIPPITIPLTLD